MRDCVICSAPIERARPAGPLPSVCSDECGRIRDRERRHPARTCEVCGVSSRERPGRWTRYCSEACDPRGAPGRHRLVSGVPCRLCASPTPKKRRAFCSDECMKRWHRNVGGFEFEQTSEKRRAQIERIGERDGWRCHICRRKVSRKNATRDHLIPRADGGTWEDENLALAHMKCNSRRGRGRLPAQLRLSA